MSRLRVGEHGNISCAKATSDSWTARTQFRCVDGIVRDRQASGPSKAAAIRTLEQSLVRRPKGVGEYLSGDSTIGDLAAAWLADVRLRDEVGTETYDYYRRAVTTLIVPGLGDCRVSELRPVAIKQFYNRILTTTGPDGEPRRTPSRPVWAHKVLTQMLRYAVEVGALDVSPARDLRAPRRHIPEVRVLSLELFHEVRAAVDAYDHRPERGPRRSHQLLDIFDLLAATGARIGEILALRWCDVDLASTPATVTISGTVLPPRDGQPIRRKDGTKTPAAMRQIAVPPFAVETMFRLQHYAPTDGPEAPVFSNRNGSWLSPNNIRREWRDCRAGHEWDWVTPHAFRKTVATLIDDHYSNPSIGGTDGAGAVVAATILGHSSETVTRAVYIKKMRRTPDVSTILQDALTTCSPMDSELRL